MRSRRSHSNSSILVSESTILRKKYPGFVDSTSLTTLEVSRVSPPCCLPNVTIDGTDVVDVNMMADGWDVQYRVYFRQALVSHIHHIIYLRLLQVSQFTNCDYLFLVWFVKPMLWVMKTRIGRWKQEKTQNTRSVNCFFLISLMQKDHVISCWVLE